MNVLIADDEEHVREGIELSIDWERFGVLQRLEAENGEEALALIRQHAPAIMFCDMSMPGMDGIQLMRRVREEGFDVQIIVVSGYDDFNYTRAAIQAGGVDYILKPFRRQELNDAMERAVTRLRQKEERLQMTQMAVQHVQKADAVLDEQRISQVLKGEVPYQDSIGTLLAKYGLRGPLIRSAMFIPRNDSDLIDLRFGGDQELFYFAVRNIAQEALEPYGAHYMCRLEEHCWMLLIHTERLDALEPRTEWRELRALVTAWRETLGLRVMSGESSGAASTSMLSGSAREARASLLKSDVLRNGSSPSEDEHKTLVRDLPRLGNMALLLHTAWNAKDKSYAAQIICEFTNHLRDLGSLRLKDLQLYTIEANLMLEQAGRLAEASSTGGLRLDRWICDLDVWEQQLTQQWWALIEESGADSLNNRGVQAIYDYIQSHYQEELSLSSLSELFHFSPQYIAKKFREYYGTTVMTLLTELRMEKARSLLLHTEISVLALSRMLGYVDENYFSKVFKKQFGSSPLQYKKMHRDS